MIPVIIGGLVVGAILLSDDDKSKQPDVTQNKHNLNKSEEQQLMRRLKHSGRRIKTVSGQPANAFQPASSGNKVVSEIAMITSL